MERGESKRYYNINGIMEEKIINGERLFRVLWSGRKAEKSWEPTEHLKNCLEYLIRFLKRDSLSFMCAKCRE
jgi:hypothetical protein